MKKIIVFTLLSLSTLCNSQSLRVGEWRDHLSYRKANQSSALNTKIYTATDEALFVYDKEDNSLEKLTTLNGLSDIGVSSIESSDNVLLIGYSNGNIDLLENNKITNLPAIFRANIIADKSINDITVIDHLAYLACGFGIVVVDLQRSEIKESYFVGENNSYINILTIEIAHNKIYASTETGILSADLNHPNLANYEAWTKVNFREQDQFNILENFNEQLFANKPGTGFNTDTLFVFDGSNWTTFGEPYTNMSIQADSNALTICRRYGVAVYDESFELTHHISSSVFNLAQADFRSCLKTGNKEYWVADKYNGLLNYTRGATQKILPSGPHHSDVAQIKNFNHEIWLAHGAKNENWDPTWSKHEVSKLVKDDWTFTNSLVENEIWDIVALNQHGDNTYLASWQKGLVKLNGMEWEELYNETNSSLQKRAVHEDWLNIGDIQFDSSGNLWCTNSQTILPLSVQYTSGEWEAFSLGSSVTESQNISKLLIDHNDQKWVQLRDNSMVVFDESRTGNQALKLTNSESQGNLVSDRIFSFAEDLDGEVWIGTDNGVSVFYDPAYVFEGEQASKILITLDEHTTHLLKGQRINDIEVDGANRKWFATNNGGVVVTSENGTEEILHFTTENSPLFSNKIIDIEINDATGEAFIATDKGLISYRSAATKGGSSFSNVLVFPNPVKPDYDGPITIKGLLTDALVKITDISGNLIYETVALGGQAVWDGRSFDGSKAHSGVYLVFCSDEDGNTTHVAKLLFIKG